MNPPVYTDTYFLWFGPVLLVLLGGVAIAVIVMRARRRLATEPTSEDPLI